MSIKCIFVKIHQLDEFHNLDIQFMKWLISLCGCDIFYIILFKSHCLQLNLKTIKMALVETGKVYFVWNGYQWLRKQAVYLCFIVKQYLLNNSFITLLHLNRKRQVRILLCRCIQRIFNYRRVKISERSQIFRGQFFGRHWVRHWILEVAGVWLTISGFCVH